jgi:hypothetical protein
MLLLGVKKKATMVIQRHAIFSIVALIKATTNLININSIVRQARGFLTLTKTVFTHQKLEEMTVT